MHVIHATERSDKCLLLAVQEAIIQEGGVEALVKLLDGGPVSAGTAAAMWALMELCVRNPGGQQALVQHGGLQKVRLLHILKFLCCREGYKTLKISGPPLSGWAALQQGSQGGHDIQHPWLPCVVLLLPVSTVG